MLIIHTTTASKKEAKKLIKKLFEARLIACAQYHKIKSVYVWKDKPKSRPKLCKDKEYLLVLKSQKACYSAIEELILTHHSYELPQILYYEANAYAPYNAWIEKASNSLLLS